MGIWSTTKISDHVGKDNRWQKKGNFKTTIVEVLKWIILNPEIKVKIGSNQ